MKKIQNLRTGFFAVLFCFFFIPWSLLAQEDEDDFSEAPAQAAHSFLDWLQEGDSVTLLLQTDLELLKRDRFLQEYQPAYVSVHNRSTDFEEEAKIKSRGKFRCQRCDLPPIKIKFTKKKMVEAGFGEWNEFKLVFPCKEGKRYEQFILKEYLIYRLYNTLTDRSFQVRYLTVRFEDVHHVDTYRSEPAFLIEHLEELEGRLGGQGQEGMGFDPTEFSREDYTRMQVFQFMIGNTDWLPVTAHNVEVVRLADGSLVPLPYDFDFSGMVGADYAVPNPVTGLMDLQTRIFMGNDKTMEELEVAFAPFRQKKEEMINLIAHFEPLDFRVRKRMIRYLQAFYKIIDNPALVRKTFIDKPPFEAPMY